MSMKKDECPCCGNTYWSGIRSGVLQKGGSGENSVWTWRCDNCGVTKLFLESKFSPYYILSKEEQEEDDQNG